MENALRKIWFYFLRSVLYDACTNLRTTNYTFGREKRFTAEWNPSTANRLTRCRSLNPIHNTSFTCLLNNHDRMRGIFACESHDISILCKITCRKNKISRGYDTRIYRFKIHLTMKSRVEVVPGCTEDTNHNAEINVDVKLILMFIIHNKNLKQIFIYNLTLNRLSHNYNVRFPNLYLYSACKIINRILF